MRHIITPGAHRTNRALRHLTPRTLSSSCRDPIGIVPNQCISRRRLDNPRALASPKLADFGLNQSKRVIALPSIRSFATENPDKNSNKTMAKTVEEALQKGELFTDEVPYTFLKFPTSSVASATTLVSKSSHFRGLLVDKDEITVMVPSQDYQQNKQGLGDSVEVGEYTYRMITFDAVLDPTLIGFMAHITKALAAAEISVLPFAAYSRDHIFVQEGDFEKAMATLKDLAAKA